MATTVTLKPNAIDISGSTSGTTTLQATAVAGTTTLTLPAATDTLVGKATTDTLTNKTLTGAAMNGTVGATTPSTGAFTTLSATGNFTFGGNLNSSLTSEFYIQSPNGNNFIGINETSAYIRLAAGGAVTLNSTSASTAFFASSTRMMDLTSTGLGIGTTSPQVQNWRAGTYLTVANASTRGQIEADAAVADSDSAALGALLFSYSTNTTNHKTVALIEANSEGATANQRGGSLNFFTKANGTASPARNMVLDSSGNLLINKATRYSAEKVSMNFAGASQQGMVTNDTSAQAGSVLSWFFSNGTAIGSITNNANTGVLYNVTSDQRLKENIQYADSASSLIDSLQVRQFDWKANGLHQRFGFVAQELVTVAPEAVYQPNDTEQMMAVDYSKLVPMLVKAIQEQQAIITQLTARITALEGA
jgi:hypothetical protein